MNGEDQISIDSMTTDKLAKSSIYEAFVVSDTFLLSPRPSRLIKRNYQLKKNYNCF
jgi:hypothetical protein